MDVIDSDRTVELNGQTLKLRWHQYDRNYRPAIQLVCENGEPWATATVNLPNEFITENEVAVKDYSENKGVLQALIDAGIVYEPVWSVQSGFVTIPVCRLKVSNPFHDELELD